ncbi:hypothetical protein ACFQH6_17305 [Halobacteriaceae archaeon GCM10025711]
MLVHLAQYRRPDTTETVRSDGDVDPERSTEEYFGKDELASAEWERVTRDGETLLRRTRSVDGVTAVSVPREGTEGDAGLPGRTIQLRVGGDSEYVEQAELVEIVDQEP